MTPRRRTIIAGLLALATFAAVTLVVQRIRARWPGLDKVVARAAEVVSPAPLAPLHRSVPELSECRSCHATASSIADSKCLKCHAEIAERKTERKGFHGTKLTGECSECHADHGVALIEFDRQAFNHRQTLFPLVESHAEIECEKCHAKPAAAPHASTKRFDYIGLAHDSCVSCHEDPHRGAFAAASPAASDAKPRACTACHDQTLWTGRHMSFTHAGDPAFALRGAHKALECDQCHVPASGAALATAKFEGLSTDCAGCHADPHRGELTAAGRTCTSCHDQESWKGDHLAFDHARDASFPLRGAHASVECAACHKSAAPGGALATADFAHTATDCASCHEDPHAGQFRESSCSDCHQESGFKGADLLFRHDSVKDFPLTGAHQAIACAACHKPTDGAAGSVKGAVFRDLPTDCASCHRDPHEGSLAPKACTVCHDTVAWSGKDLKFDHRSRATSDFALDAMHSALSCTACHESHVFKPKPTGCAVCHETEAAHLEGRIAIAGELEKWAPSPHAGLVKCADCHDATNARERPEDVAKSCARCHTQHYATLLLEQRAHLGEIVAQARSLLDAGVAKPDDPRRAILDAALAASAHDYVPAEQRCRAILEALQKP